MKKNKSYKYITLALSSLVISIKFSEVAFSFSLGGNKAFIFLIVVSFETCEMLFKHLCLFKQY